MFKKRGLGKRGTLETVLFILIDLIVLIFVSFFMLGYVDKTVESTTFEKNFLARDSALLIDTLYISPGNTVINYPQDTLWFSFNFKKNKVEVYDDETTGKPGSYFIEDRNMEFIPKEIKPEKKIENKEKIIDKYFSLRSTLFTFEPILEEGTFVKLAFGKIGKKLIVDEQKVELEPRLLECVDIEKEPLEKIPPTANWFVRDPNSQEIIDKINDEAHISVLTFPGSHKDINVIKAYIPAEGNKHKKSKNLACNILNNILKNDKLKDAAKKNNLASISGIGIIPSDSFSILEKGNIIVLIEISNAGMFNNDEARSAVEESINRAIESTLK